MNKKPLILFGVPILMTWLPFFVLTVMDSLYINKPIFIIKALNVWSFWESYPASISEKMSEMPFSACFGFGLAFVIIILWFKKPSKFLAIAMFFTFMGLAPLSWLGRLTLLFLPLIFLFLLFCRAYLKFGERYKI